MLEVRPLVINDKNMVLGGNMRLKALLHLGYTEVPVDRVKWSKKKELQFIIQDNLNFGAWDWNILANEWNTADLNEWGLKVPELPSDVDYSLLDEESLEDQLNDFESNVKKGILIEFNPEHYENAREIINFWRKNRLYVGGFLIEKLNEEKKKLNDKN
jgi:ParB-like chromosome segregation protein Spo0J